MKRFKYMAMAVLVGLPILGDVLAAQREGSRAFQIHNRIRVEYDDNVLLTDQDTESSFKIIEEVELYVNLNLENTFVSVRYRPSFTYWDNRDADDTDFHHDLDFVLNQAFSPRLNLSIKDTFRIAELPELNERGATLRENNDFLYNSLNGTLGYLFTPETRAEVAGRYILLQYDDSDVADREDYDMYAGGFNLRHQVVPETAIQGEFRIETIEYDGPDRGSDSFQLGGGVEQTFSPNLLGNLRGGYQYKEFNSAVASDEDSPFIDGSLTILPSPATRISLGGGYSLYEADVFPYVNQDRFLAFASLAHDWTARLSWFLSTSYALSLYDSEEALESEPTPVDGDENVIQLSTKLSYRLNRSNSLEASWQLVDLDSDVREDYERNRLSLGWKTEL